nr:sulfate/thiosulfate ABC transporter permease CysW [Thermoanaerobaculia bacterium]
MAGVAQLSPGAQRPALREPRQVRGLLIVAAVAFLALFLWLPLLAVFAKAFEAGVSAYWAAIRDPYALAALQLTLLTAALVVPVNLVFGVAAAWAIARFRFPGRGWLITLIDVPFSVSPVIAGMMMVLLFGAQGVFGPWLASHELKIVFALPGIVLATLFVTLPLVARELIPLLAAQG